MDREKVQKIMIVDDNKEFLSELKEILDLTGYQSIAINDSKSAFATACKKKPDLILLDLRMDGLNGFHVAEKLKQTPETCAIPIIAMSGYFPVDKQSLLIDRSNMAACIKKPFSISDVINQIETVLGENKKAN